MKSESITIRSGPLALEAVLTLDQGPKASALVVVCQPHPLYGGDMDSHVVKAVCLTLHEKGIASLRFNFRGVGQSEGQFDDGIGEADDLRAAITALERMPEIDGTRIGVSGYSFGATVAMVVAASDGYRVKGLAAISPSLGSLTAGRLSRYNGPSLLVSGERDQFAPQDRLQDMVDQLSDECKCCIIEGEDHFWGLRVEEMAQAVAEFFAAHLL
ncbi:MAG: dienelactone hydrolase family protein [Chloroflexi bacterium]|nr:dienelactone hydrolase family protein [Chloroflexota bacterium]